MVTVRPYQPFDLPGMYQVCLRTGDSGQDATTLYRNPDLLAHIYAGPYPVADPGLSFVAVDEQGVLGYIIATADTLEFETWQEEHWWPGLREQYPVSLGQDPQDGTQDWLRIAHIHRSRPTPDDLYEKFPAHMHIDILPGASDPGSAGGSSPPSPTRCAPATSGACTWASGAATRARSPSTRRSASTRNAGRTGVPRW